MSAVWRIVPAAGVILTFCHLARGGFRGFSQLGWWEAACVVLLVAGITGSAWRRIRRNALGAPTLFRDDLEVGSGLVAATFVVVATGGPQIYPLVYVLMAFLVSFLPR